MDLTLVILAAGKGTRFGGDKPLAAVGPNNECLFEYSVREARFAGFNQIVFVVSPQQDTRLFVERLSKYKDSVKISFAVQDNAAEVEAVGESIVRRSKPWGTGHAVLVCRPFIETPFVVINADDFYGAENFERIGRFLKDNISTPHVAALPGYALKNTISESGGVNRGVCAVTKDGYLASIREYTNISVKSGVVHADNLSQDAALSLDAQVSMTFWGFYPEFFATLKSAFDSFLRLTQNPELDEFYLPSAVEFAIRSDQLRVKVFPSSACWRGITYAEDVSDVREFLCGQPAV